MSDPSDSPELSRRSALLSNLALSRASVDRAEHLRADEQWWRQAQSSEDSVVLLLGTHGAPHSSDGPDQAPRLMLVPAGTPGIDEFGEPALLGVDDGQAVITRWVRSSQSEDASELVRRHHPEGTGVHWQDLRAIGADLDDRDAGLLTTAVALLGWHGRHRHCPRCGTVTLVTSAGWSRHCPSCETDQFPRTDPAVIVLVRSPESDRALLGRRSIWPASWYSTLAGFVEAGESSEATVVREVREEAGVEVDSGSLAYLGSQPWPFPASLMLGYHAWATSEQEPTPDGDELAEARWISREELLAGAESGELLVPPSVSIARRLIEQWYGAELPGEWSRP